MAEKRKFTRQEPLESAVPKCRSKRTKKPTVCADKIRGYLRVCGICGSGNIAIHGVTYCTICGAEEPFLDLSPIFLLDYNRKIIKPICDCIPQDKYGHIYVRACIDCGAVTGPHCPVCKSKMWAQNDKRYCTMLCGYSR
jgi:hypothetical protein